MKGSALTSLLLAGALVACADNQPPLWAELAAQRATVNSLFTLALHASDRERDALRFDFAPAAHVASARIEATSDDHALFLWTPSINDVGVRALSFGASDGDSTALASVSVEVVMPPDAGAPRFVQPLGTGTTMDVTNSACLELPIAIEDPDSTSVELRQEARIDGAELEQTGPFEGRWTFCPTPVQMADDDRYALRLVADDGESALTVKHYLVVLRHGDAPEDVPSDEPPSDPVGLCETCAGDGDCGGAHDLCVWWDDEPRCLSACDSVDDCPAGYFCSFSPLGSVDGQSARQCLPNDYQCPAP